MPSSDTMGAPCLVPAQFKTGAGALRGFITRISATAALVSCDPPLEMNSRVELSFRRPGDSLELVAMGTVVRQVSEGGLWRGRPSTIVRFDEPIDLADDGSGPTAPGAPTGLALGGALTSGLGRRRGGGPERFSGSSRHRGPAASIPGAGTSTPDLTALSQPAGNWRKLGAMSEDDVTAPPTARSTGSFEVLPESDLDADPQPWPSEELDDEDDATVIPGQLLDTEPELLSGGDAMDPAAPFQPTEPTPLRGPHEDGDPLIGAAADYDSSDPYGSSGSFSTDFFGGSEPDAPPSQDDDAFIGMFGGGAAPQHSLPPSMLEDSITNLQANSSLAEAPGLLGTPTEDFGGPASGDPIGGASPDSLSAAPPSLGGFGEEVFDPFAAQAAPSTPTPPSLDLRDGYFDLKNTGSRPPVQGNPPPPPGRPPSRSPAPPADGDGSGAWSQPRRGTQPGASAAGPGGQRRVPTAEQRAQAKAAIAAHRRATGSAPATQRRSSAPWDSTQKASLLPRNTRIASTMPINFWARGKTNKAIAQNFSADGVFLETRTDPPVRGAIVRVEFPLEGDGEAAPIRFNAEVRWHRADRPGAGLAEGFGVQILTFETPKDRARYEEICQLLLSIQPEAESSGGEFFSWGGKK